MNRAHFGLSSSTPSLRSPISARSSHDWLHGRETTSGLSASPRASPPFSSRLHWESISPHHELDTLADRLGRQMSNLREHVNLVVHPLESKLNSAMNKQPMLEWQLSEFGGSLRAMEDELKLRVQQWDAAESQLQKWKKQLEHDVHSMHRDLQRGLGESSRRLDELEGQLSRRQAQPAERWTKTEEFLSATQLLRMELRQCLGMPGGKELLPGAAEALKSPKPLLEQGEKSSVVPASELVQLAEALRRDIGASTEQTTEQIAQVEESYRKGLASVGKHVSQVEERAGELFANIMNLQEDFAAWKASSKQEGAQQQGALGSMGALSSMEENSDNSFAGKSLCTEASTQRLDELERQSLDTLSSMTLLQKTSTDTSSAVRGIADEILAMQQQLDALAETVRAVALGTTDDVAVQPPQAQTAVPARPAPTICSGACVPSGMQAAAWLRSGMWGLLLLASQDVLWKAVEALAGQLHSEIPAIWRKLAELAAANRCNVSSADEEQNDPASESAAPSPDEEAKQQRGHQCFVIDLPRENSQAKSEAASEDLEGVLTTRKRGGLRTPSGPSPRGSRRDGSCPRASRFRPASGASTPAELCHKEPVQPNAPSERIKEATVLTPLEGYLFGCTVEEMEKELATTGEEERCLAASSPEESPA